ncbi:MAG: hypothetical protein K8U03_21485, partial [Planctomycetia bacterium]|nr:hypothetical protein [Planctomycetia bacterium]
QLSYQGVDGGAAWQPIVVPTSRPAADGKWSGTTSFVPAGALPPLYVRAEVTDAAGNQASAQSQLDPRPGDPTTNPNALPAISSPQALGVPSPAAPSQAAKNPGPWQPAAPGTPAHSSNYPPAVPSPVVGPAANGNDPPSMARSFPGREQIPPGAAPAYANNSPGMFGGESPRGNEVIPPGRSQGVNPTSTPNNRGSAPSRSAADKAGDKVAEVIGPGDAELLPTPTPLPKNNRNDDPLAARNSAEPGPSFGSPSGSQLPKPAPSSDFSQPSAARPVENGKEPPKVSSIAGEDGPTPPGVKPRLVNSRRFELDYDIESVGTAGVAKVELWGTRDGGKSWTSLGNDPDSTSPYVVIVDREGVYGFRMVIESTTGLRGPAPQPGELPEVWVGVDVTKPDCKITSAQVGTGEHAGELEVRWDAKDAALMSRPAALAFSEAADGPWTMIASGLTNQGYYAWRIDSRTPGRMFLKLDVRDEAGNVGTFITPEPVVIDRVRPQGKIRGVRPIGESARLRLPAEMPKR